MEPSGGPGPGPVPVPGNNKGRGGAAAPGRGRDLARPPRKDSEVSAAGSGAAFPGGAGRAGPRPGPAHGCRCPGAVPVSGRCRCPVAPVFVDPCGCQCPALPALLGHRLPREQPRASPSAGSGSQPVLLVPDRPLPRYRFPGAVAPGCGAERPLLARPTLNRGCPDPGWSRSVPVSPSSIPFQVRAAVTGLGARVALSAGPKWE